MDKNELIDRLEKLKKGILKFQEDKMSKIINIPPSKIKIPKSQQKHMKDGNESYKHAILSNAYHMESNKQKKRLYNNDKTRLKREYGAIKEYIKTFGENPGINGMNCYDSFFLNDDWSGEDKNHKSVISDIDIIIGKIEGLSDKEIQRKINPNPKNYWQLYNPLYWIVKGGEICFKNKLISWIILFLITTIIGLVITKTLEPTVDYITKPFQKTASGIIMSIK